MIPISLPACRKTTMLFDWWREHPAKPTAPRALYREVTGATWYPIRVQTDQVMESNSLPRKEKSCREIPREPCSTRAQPPSERRDAVRDHGPWRQPPASVLPVSWCLDAPQIRGSTP